MPDGDSGSTTCRPRAGPPRPAPPLQPPARPEEPAPAASAGDRRPPPSGQARRRSGACFPPFPLASRFGVPFAASANVPPRSAPKIGVSPSRTNRGPSRSPDLRGEKVWGTSCGNKDPRSGRSRAEASWAPRRLAPDAGRQCSPVCPGPSGATGGGREPRRGGAARGLPEMHREAAAPGSRLRAFCAARLAGPRNHACASGKTLLHRFLATVSGRRQIICLFPSQIYP